MVSFKALPVKVGILGGGQLARMMALAAQGIGVSPFIFAAKPTDCACQVTNNVSFSSEPDALDKFCESVDILTIENEFLDLEELERVLKKTGKSIFPSIATLARVQSKLEQKKRLLTQKIPTLDFVAISSLKNLEDAYKKFAGRLVVKTARFGYDGKGTFIFRDEPQRWREFLKSFKPSPKWGYAEPLAIFKKELSVIVVRNEEGQVVTYPVVKTVQSSGVCEFAVTPAPISVATAKIAQKIAMNVITTFEGVGAFAIEMFYLGGTKIVVNEIAPRVHNSGHVTMNACLVSQFEQHLRAGLGLEMFGTELCVKAAAMANILGRKKIEVGELIATKQNLGTLPADVWLHWYGKTGQGYSRKLGHINAVGKNTKSALKAAMQTRAVLDI